MIDIQRTCFTVALGGLTAWVSVAHAQTAPPADLVNAHWLTRQDGERIIAAAAAARVP